MKEEYDFSKGKRGAIDRTPAHKTRITIRLDNDVLDWFRQQVDNAGGGNYQTLINRALCDHIKQQSEDIEQSNRLEETIRRVIRQELHTAQLQA